MIYTPVFNQGGRGVRSPLEHLNRRKDAWRRNLLTFDCSERWRYTAAAAVVSRYRVLSNIRWADMEVIVDDA